MATPFTPGVGAVTSADIAVPDHPRALAFYAQVLCTGERPLWREDLASASGLPVIGLGARDEAYAALPIQWMPHFQVEDVAASTAAAVSGGGRVLYRGGDAASAWAVVLDPRGAAFGLVGVEAPPEEGDAPNARAAAGRIAGVSLSADDAAAAAAYYAAVLGCPWGPATAVDAPEGAAYVVEGPGTPAAVFRSAAAAAAPLPAVWLLHLPVGDLDESLERVWDGGGVVLHVERGEDEAAQRAAIRDPVGASLVLVAAHLTGG